MSKDNIELDLRVRQVLEEISSRNPELAKRLQVESPAANLVMHVISQVLQHGADPAHAADVVHGAIDSTLAQTMERDVDTAPVPIKTRGPAPGAAPAA